MAKSKSSKVNKVNRNVWVVVAVVLAALVIWGVGKYNSRPQVKSTESATFPPGPEVEPNNTFADAKARGDISIAQNATYTGNFDASGTGNDEFYILNTQAGAVRKFSLTTANPSGLQLVLNYFPASGGSTAIVFDNDGVAPNEITGTMAQTGDYTIQIYKPVGNTDPWTLTITDPNYVAACPWSSTPIDISVLPGTGSMQSSGAYITNNTLFQSFWRGDQGWYRSIPINPDQSLGTPGAWSGPIPLSNLPGTGSIQAQSEYVLGGYLRQGIWQSDKGYTRDVPIVNGLPNFSCVPVATPVPSATPTPIPAPNPTATPTRTPTPTTVPTSTPRISPSPVQFTTTLLPVADAKVTSTAPGTNYGTGSSLRVVALAGSETSKTYLKYNISGLVDRTVTLAKMRVYVSNVSNDSRNIKQVTNSTWIESGTGSITYSNAPAVGTVITTMPAVTATGWTGYYTVTTWVQNQVALAQTYLTVGVDSTTGGDGFEFNSKENTGGNPAQLVVTYY